jgi:hypothetical protein
MQNQSAVILPVRRVKASCWAQWIVGADDNASRGHVTHNGEPLWLAASCRLASAARVVIDRNKRLYFRCQWSPSVLHFRQNHCTNRLVPQHHCWKRGRPHGKEIYLCNRPWRPIRLWDVEAPTLPMQSAHRWRRSCQSYAPTSLYSPGRFMVLISVWSCAAGRIR